MRTAVSPKIDISDFTYYINFENSEGVTEYSKQIEINSEKGFHS